MPNETDPLLSPLGSSSRTEASPLQQQQQQQQQVVEVPSEARRDKRATEQYAMAFWTAGCLYGATSVMLGAFGAHGLKKRIADPARIANWDTAAKYQALHSVAMLVGTIAAPKNKLAGGLFAAGITMFSGSIYLLVLDPQRFKVLGPVTPIGGLCLIGGWLALAFGSRGRIML